MAQSVTDWIIQQYRGAKHVDPSLGEHPAVTSPHIVIGARNYLQDGDTLTKAGDSYPTMNDFTSIGLVQSASVQQNKNLQQLWELASSQSYVIPGRTVIGASLSRILIDGQSLMRCLYGELELELGDAGFVSDTSSYVINLASKFMDNSVDLLVLMFGHNYEPLGGFILENSYITQHNMVLSSSNAVVLESVNLIANRITGLST